MIDALITLFLFIYVLGLLTFYGCQSFLTILIMKGYELPGQVNDMIQQDDGNQDNNSFLKASLAGLIPIVNLIVGLDLLSIIIQMWTGRTK